MSRKTRCACADCARVMLHYGRGLCATCWARHWQAGTLHRFARRTRSSERLVAEAERIRRQVGEPVMGRDWDGAPVLLAGITWAEVAERLGVSAKALDKARERVRARNRPDRVA